MRGERSFSDFTEEQVKQLFSENGFEVLEYMDKNGLLAKIPVSIITGNDYKNTIERVFAYPIVDVLSKPFNERDIKKIIEKSIIKKK